MAKRKNVESEEDESAAYSSDASSAPKPISKGKKTSQSQTIKKPPMKKTEGSESEEAKEPASKKAKREPKKKASHTSEGPSTGPKIKTNKDGDKYLDLGKKKHATVRVFKGMPLLDIREFYGDDDDLKPGKKGISLTIEQWAALRDGVSDLDKLLQAVKK